MKTLRITVVAAVLVAATAWGLPAELVVLSAKEARADEAAAFYYLGSCGAGYLYNGSSAAVARVAPYRILDGDAQTKDYYIVWAPAWVKVAPEDFAHLGTSVRLSEYEILVGLERGFGPGELRAVDHRIELIKLEPVTPVEWRYDGEAPPTEKDPAIEGAINTITEGEYAGYIKTLQDFETRYTYTEGNRKAREYILSFFTAQDLDAYYFEFEILGVSSEYAGPKYVSKARAKSIRAGEARAFNVIGERLGESAPDEIVIIGGHYDSASEVPYELAPGAEDNGSGAACAMAAARAFKELSFGRTVRYIAFGAEEEGCIGSRAYARFCAGQGENIIAFLNADMVAYDEDEGLRDDYVAGTGDNGKWLFGYLTAVGGLYGRKIIYEDLGHTVSDDQSFESVGYAAMGVIEGEKGSGGITEYPYYHTTEDTLDKLHPALGVRFVRDYAAMFAHLAGFDDTGVEEPKLAAAAVPFARPFAVYPNPYSYATAAGGINFVGVKAPAKVEIYDLAGRRVAREEIAAGRDACVWRPATPEGETLAPGVYLYRLEGQEQEKAGKIVIAR